MKYVLALAPVLQVIAAGGMFRVVFAWLFRAASAMAVLGVLWVSWMMWNSTGRGLPITAFLSFLVVQIALLAIAYAIVNILIIRSFDIMNLPGARTYPITPIVVVVTRACGEIAFVTFSITGIGMGVAGFISRARIPLPIQLPFAADMMAAAGGGAMISGVLIGFLLLVSFYLAAELIGVLVDIAVGVNRGR